MAETSAARRRSAGAGLAALSAITGVVSYEHGLEVVRWVGNRGLVAYLVPLVPDLMIVTSSLTLIEASAARLRRPVMAMVALVAGIGWTVAMNVAAGWRHGLGGALIAAGIPLAFVVTFESLLWLFRRARGTAGGAAPPAGGRCPHGVAGSADEAVRAAYEHARDCEGAPVSQRRLAAAFGMPRARVAVLARGGDGAADDAAGTVRVAPAVPAARNGQAPHE